MNAPARPASTSAAAHARPAVSLDGEITILEACVVIDGRADVIAGDRTLARLEEAGKRLTWCLENRRVVYGITTGFGPLATQHMDPSNLEAVQRNLIYHLASGVGEPMGWHEARALMLSRLISMTRGYSAASRPLVDLMIACLSRQLAPWVPEKGTVGASGDLTPSSHMALALMGEGAFITRDGARVPAGEALAAAGLKPYNLKGRDGLALVNGTSAMTGIAVLNQRDADNAAAWSAALSVIHAEAMGGRTESWGPLFGEIRPHPGQRDITARLQKMAGTSGRLDSSLTAERSVDPVIDGSLDPVATACPQDPYSIRCVPQILGAVSDTLEFHRGMVERELNSVTDNPVFGEEEPYAMHGGNFYGQHVAMASDALQLALIKTAILSERQIARITDPLLNGDLPAFLQPNRTGLHSGFMGAQVTASALLAEMRSNAIPASVQSVPTNGNNQDVVSMGTIAARKSRKTMDDLYAILAIQALICAQAKDLTGDEKKWSAAGDAVHRLVRDVSPKLEADRPLSGCISRVADKLRNTHAERLTGQV